MTKTSNNTTKETKVDNTEETKVDNTEETTKDEDLAKRVEWLESELKNRDEEIALFRKELDALKTAKAEETKEDKTDDTVKVDNKADKKDSKTTPSKENNKLNDLWSKVTTPRFIGSFVMVVLLVFVTLAVLTHSKKNTDNPLTPFRVAPSEFSKTLGLDNVDRNEEATIGTIVNFGSIDETTDLSTVGEIPEFSSIYVEFISSDGYLFIDEYYGRAVIFPYEYCGGYYTVDLGNDNVQVGRIPIDNEEAYRDVIKNLDALGIIYRVANNTEEFKTNASEIVTTYEGVAKETKLLPYIENFFVSNNMSTDLVKEYVVGVGVGNGTGASILNYMLYLDKELGIERENEDGELQTVDGVTIFSLYGMYNLQTRFAIPSAFLQKDITDENFDTKITDDDWADLIGSIVACENEIGSYQSGLNEYNNEQFNTTGDSIGTNNATVSSNN